MIQHGGSSIWYGLDNNRDTVFNRTCSAPTGLSLTIQTVTVVQSMVFEAFIALMGVSYLNTAFKDPYS